MANGRAKGSAAEREVAKIVAEWWRAIEPLATFRRTPMSGGWSSSAENRGRFKTSGDLVTDAERFPWCVEVKRRENWSDVTFLAGRPSPVWGWWRQAQRQADEAGLVPVLWFRRSIPLEERHAARREWTVMLPAEYTGSRKHVLAYDPGLASRLPTGALLSWPRPTAYWLRSQLRGRRVGAHPICYSHVELLALHPEVFARPRGG